MKVKKYMVRFEENARGTTHFPVYFTIKYIDSSAVSLRACERFFPKQKKSKTSGGWGGRGGLCIDSKKTFFPPSLLT